MYNVNSSDGDGDDDDGDNDDDCDENGRKGRKREALAKKRKEIKKMNDCRTFLCYSRSIGHLPVCAHVIVFFVCYYPDSLKTCVDVCYE